MGEGFHCIIERGQGIQPSLPTPLTVLGQTLAHLPGRLQSLIQGRTRLDPRSMEARVIEEALKRSRYNVTAAARLLGVTRQTLRYRIEKHGIQGTR